MSGAAVVLSPFARCALTDDELAGIRARAVALEARVNAVRAGNGAWTVYATSPSIRVSRHDARGSLAAAINVLLDAFRDEKERVAASLAAMGFPDGLSLVWCSSCAEPAIVNRNGEAACVTHARELLEAAA